MTSNTYILFTAKEVFPFTNYMLSSACGSVRRAQNLSRTKDKNISEYSCCVWERGSFSRCVIQRFCTWILVFYMYLLRFCPIRQF